MGVLCALLLAFSGSSLVANGAETASWSGRMQKGAVQQLKGRTDTVVRNTSFAYGAITDAKTFNRFVRQAFPQTSRGEPHPVVTRIAKDIDWDKDAILYVIRTARTHSVKFDSWQPKANGTATLKIQFRAIEPAYANEYPVVLCRVSKTNLKSVSLQVNMDGWAALGAISLPAAG